MHNVHCKNAMIRRVLSPDSRRRLDAARDASNRIGFWSSDGGAERETRPHATSICVSSSPLGSFTCTAQAMHGSKEWMVRWISSG